MRTWHCIGLKVTVEAIIVSSKRAWMRGPRLADFWILIYAPHCREANWKSITSRYSIIKGTQVICFEALIRWNHPQRGSILPSESISLAEETRLIIPIGDWVLRTACMDAVRWPQNIRLAVNISPVEFENHNLVASVCAALSASGLAANRLELEITERVLLQNSEGSLTTLH